MQHTFAINLRVSFSDPEKYKLLEDAVKAAAKHLQASAILLRDSVQSEIQVVCEDWVGGEREIALLDHDIATGETMILDAAGGTMPDAPNHDPLNDLMTVLNAKEASSD